MDIRNLFICIAIYLQNCHVLCYKGQALRVYSSRSLNDSLMESHIRRTQVFCSVKGDKLKVRFSLSCPMCESQKVKLFQCNTWNLERERELDALDKETIFHGVPDGSYRIVVERGRFTTNLTGCCEVKNQGKMVQRSNLVVYLTITGCCIFAVSLAIGLFLSLHVYKRNMQTTLGVRHYDQIPLHTHGTNFNNNSESSTESVVEPTTMTWV